MEAYILLKKKQASVVASKERGLEVNTVNTKYMVRCGEQEAWRIHNMKRDNRCWEMVEGLKYLGKPLTHQISIQDKINSRLKSGNACYYSVQNLMSSSLLFKKLKIQIAPKLTARYIHNFYKAAHNTQFLQPQL